MSATQSSGLLLDLVTIDVPCTSPWDDMSGNDRMRFCSACKLHVYNLSEMTRDEAEALIVSRAGQRLCGRFYRRPDGTVMTRDCFSVRRAVRRSLALTVSLAAGFLLAIIGWMTWALTSSKARSVQQSPREIEPLRTVLNWLDPQPRAVMGKVAMGGISCPPSPRAAPLLANPANGNQIAPANE